MATIKDCRCENCGHPVPAEGVSIDPDDDIDLTGHGRERCSDTACVVADTAHGVTFAAWLSAADRRDSVSEYDLRAAWRAGEDPAEYHA